jgi:hypothetical protein
MSRATDVGTPTTRPSLGAEAKAWSGAAPINSSNSCCSSSSCFRRVATSAASGAKRAPRACHA